MEIKSQRMVTAGCCDWRERGSFGRKSCGLPRKSVAKCSLRIQILLERGGFELAMIYELSDVELQEEF